ncbi:hypothetical protein GCM10012285_32600 [Streptomyces kronopolitis]|uniref:Uncharacterized protein n=1 Tax=Streptomyces kronopolitis TaxID=1612435 RepID=A0ABQ2JK44_9ACTN|nr:hypothetical protein [Streptomyces kronopolitis]GGN47158.1 hypothetical protein GCM10012285_32600 [Streptomyces kronopolitis]
MRHRNDKLRSLIAGASAGLVLGLLGTVPAQAASERQIPSHSHPCEDAPVSWHAHDDNSGAPVLKGGRARPAAVTVPPGSAG